MPTFYYITMAASSVKSKNETHTHAAHMLTSVLCDILF